MNDTRKKIIAALTLDEFLSNKELEVITGLKEGTVRYNTRMMVKDGLIHVSHTGRTTAESSYATTEVNYYKLGAGKSVRRAADMNKKERTKDGEANIVWRHAVTMADVPKAANWGGYMEFAA